MDKQLLRPRELCVEPGALDAGEPGAPDLLCRTGSTLCWRTGSTWPCVSNREHLMLCVSNREHRCSYM